MAGPPPDRNAGRARSWSILLRSFVPCVLLVAGIAKIVDVSEFEAALRTWERLPGWSMRPLSLLIPAAEILIGASWLLSVRRSLAELGALSLLFAFTGAYILHLASGLEPDCNCFGKIMRFRMQQTTATEAIIRNVILIGVMGVAAIVDHRTRGAPFCGPPAPFPGDPPA